MKALPRLQGGLMAHLTSKSAIAMSAAVLHAVVTIVKGFVVTISFLESRSVQGMSTWIQCNPFAIYEEDKGTLIENWINAAEMDLYTMDQEVVLVAWLQVRESFLSYARGEPRQACALRDFWKPFLAHTMFGGEARETYEAGLKRDVQVLEEISKRPTERGSKRKEKKR